MREFLDRDYLSYISNKKVALVGPASYLTILNMGKIIDSHDIVVRVNRGLELISSYPKNVGTRSDILYNCGIKKLDNGGNLNIEYFKSKKVKWVSTTPNSDHNGHCHDNSLHPLVDKNFIEQAKINFKFHLMDWHDYFHINKHVKCRSNTGFAAIFDLLNHNPSELFICGYSFYLDSFIKGYKDGCERDEEEFAKQCFVSERHVQPNQWSYLKKYVHKEKRITTDPILGKILNMEKLSREKFRQIIHTN